MQGLLYLLFVNVKGAVLQNDDPVKRDVGMNTQIWEVKDFCI